MTKLPTAEEFARDEVERTYRERRERILRRVTTCCNEAPVGALSPTGFMCPKCGSTVGLYRGTAERKQN